jgi:hypothetical protein
VNGEICYNSEVLSKYTGATTVTISVKIAPYNRGWVLHTQLQIIVIWIREVKLSPNLKNKRKFDLRKTKQRYPCHLP